MASPYDPAPPRGLRGGLGWPLSILTVILLALLVRFWKPWERSLTNPAAESRAVEPRGTLADEEKTNIDIYRKASPAVVHIETLQVKRDAWTMDPEKVSRGTGSGFIWDKEGHVVTNAHVVQGSEVCRVILADHSIWEAKVVGGNPRQDLAVLLIETPAAQLQPISIGTSSDLEVGQKVFAIGNPFGLDQTLTTGIVSGLGRKIRSMVGNDIEDVIQTDAAINPGNSGGPLLDSHGRLIGINTAIQSPSGASAGIGFAVPVDTINRDVPQIIRHGRIRPPDLGASFLADHITRRFRVAGAVVYGVKPGGPADKARLQPLTREGTHLTLGDVIVSVDDRPVRSASELIGALADRAAGQSVKLGVRRGEQIVQVDVTLPAG